VAGAMKEVMAIIAILLFVVVLMMFVLAGVSV
jgi:hypothetical protein